MQYLSNEVPPEARTAPMHNTILEAALHLGNGKLALEALQHVRLSGSLRNSRTAAAMLRIMVGSPNPPMLCPCARKCCSSCCTLCSTHAVGSYDPLGFSITMNCIVIHNHDVLMLLLHDPGDSLACLTCAGGIQMCGKMVFIAVFCVQGRWQTADIVCKSWTLMEPQLKQHVTVNAAYVEALCMRSQVPEAMQAFEQMLELYATQYHPKGSQEAGIHSQHLQTQSIALTDENTARHGSSSIDTQQPSDSYKCSNQVQALKQRWSGVGEAADEQLGAPGQRSSSASAAEPASLAQRAAQAACHQVLNAVAREGLAKLPSDVLQALHQVQHAVTPFKRGLGLWIAPHVLSHAPLHQLCIPVVAGLFVHSYEEGDIADLSSCQTGSVHTCQCYFATLSPRQAGSVLRLRCPCRLACSQTLPSATAS